VGAADEVGAEPVAPAVQLDLIGLDLAEVAHHVGPAVDRLMLLEPALEVDFEPSTARRATRAVRWHYTFAIRKTNSPISRGDRRSSKGASRKLSKISLMVSARSMAILCASERSRARAQKPRAPRARPR